MNLATWGGALALGLQGVPPGGAPLAPTGKWQVAFEEGLCGMAHGFGEGPSAATLAFKSVPLSGDLEVFLFRTNDRTSINRGKATLILRPSGQTFRADYVGYSVRGDRVVRLQLKREILEGLNVADGLSIVADGAALTLTVPSAAGALRILDKCELMLLTRWNVDPSLRDQPRLEVRGNPGQFFSYTAYPDSALKAKIQGRVVVLLKVNAQGKADECRVVSRSQSADLDAATCRSALKIRFAPQHGSDGRPSPKVTALAVRWELPD